MSVASIAINRFGLGARPDEPVPADGKRWLLDQLGRYTPRPTPIAGAVASTVVAANLANYLAEQRQFRQANGGKRAASAAPMSGDTMAGDAAAGGPRYTRMPARGAQASLGDVAQPATAGAPDPVAQARRFARQQGQDYYATAVAARCDAALTTPAPFAERLVHFWSNHFAVSADKLTVVGLAPTLEFEAVRPHLMGRFGDMLNAAERHPAMLLYLDQAQSVGPNSPLGSRAQRFGNRQVGLNENLAREIMELHTLGVRTGYTQADVTEFARAMTGWTVAGLGRGVGARLAGTAGSPGEYRFAPALHEPGDRTVMGKRYSHDGERQAQSVLDDLAVHPATARHLATKLTRHFAGDAPPPAMVARLETAFLRSRGDLPTVYRAIVESPEAWAPGTVKFRTPWEWSIGALRALGYTQVPAGPSVGLLGQLGQPLWRPGSPAGYDDIAGSWAGPDAVLRRVEAAERLASRAGAIDARVLAPKLFPGALDSSLAQAIARADSPGQGLALLLVAPDMMRR